MKTLKDIRKVYLHKIGNRNGLEVWLVDGSYIRREIHIDFVYGGNGLRYKFIPENEIWVDDDVSVDELDFTIAHEIYERNLMLEGLSYDQAHRLASRHEHQLRKKSLNEVLKKIENSKPREAGARRVYKKG